MSNKYIQIANSHNVKETFNDLVRDVIWEKGNNVLNGEISTTSLDSEILIPKVITKNKKLFLEWVEENHDLVYPIHRRTQYSKLEKLHYQAFTVEWSDNKKRPMREVGVTNKKRYSLVLKTEEDLVNQEDALERGFTYDTLTEAKIEAKKIALATGEEVTIKQHRSDGALFNLGHILLTTDGKAYKSERRAKNKIYKPIYKVAFFIYATQ